MLVVCFLLAFCVVGAWCERWAKRARARALVVSYARMREVRRAVKRGADAYDRARDPKRTVPERAGDRIVVRRAARSVARLL